MRYCAMIQTRLKLKSRKPSMEISADVQAIVRSWTRLNLSVRRAPVVSPVPMEVEDIVWGMAVESQMVHAA
jgi:hypothetical protein